MNAGNWPIKADAWVLLGVLDLPRMHWGAEPSCRFVHDRAAVVGWDGNVAPCYALAHNYDYLTIDGRRKQVTRCELGNVTQQRRDGDKHVYGARSRFVSDALLETMERGFHGRGDADRQPLGSRSDKRIDVASRMRDMW